jgi:hypothetical protein
MSSDQPAAGSPSASRRPLLKKVIKIGLLVGVVAFIGIQFIPVEGVGVNPPQRFNIGAPPEVEAILRASCFDCHSNETKWPFYARIAPASWLLIKDVKKGRSRMNFSEWGDVGEEDRQLDKESSWDQIEEGEMPLEVYIYPMHLEARLDDKKKAVLKSWLLAHQKDEKKDEEKK